MKDSLDIQNDSSLIMNSANLIQYSMVLAWIICSLGIVFYSYEFLLRIAPSVMVPEVRAYFNISAAGFGSLIGLYYVAYTPMQLFVGAIMDLYGPRRILTFAVAICAVGTLIFSTTHAVWLAGVGRFIIGFGSAFAFVGALKLASVWLPSNLFATFAGIVSGVAMAGAIAGDVILTSFVQHTYWQTTMIAGGIVGLILVPIFWFLIKDTPNNATQETSRVSYQDLFAGYLGILRNSQIWLSGFIACMLYLALSAFAEIWGIPFLRDAFHFSPQQAAVANSMVFLGWVIGAPTAGFISDKFGNGRKLLLWGSIGAGLSMAAVLYTGDHSFISASLLLLLFGLFTSVEIICFAVGLENAPRQIGGTAVAFVNMLTMLGGFVFQPLIGKFLDMVWSGHLENGIRVYTAHDYRIALTALPFTMIVSAILTLSLRKPMAVQQQLPFHE